MANSGLKLRGKVTATHGQFFTIQLETHEVLATRCGRLQVNKVHIMPGDVVEVELCPYYLRRGRILWRQ